MSVVSSTPELTPAGDGFGDWVPIVEVRRVIEKGKTVRMQLLIRGETGERLLDLTEEASAAIELKCVRWDVLAVARES